MNWTANLQYLQIILQKFNADMVISEPILIRLFCNGLWPSIYAQAKEDSC